MPPFPESTSKSKSLKPSVTSTATPTPGTTTTTTSAVTVTPSATNATTPTTTSTTGTTGTSVTTVTATSTPTITSTTGITTPSTLSSGPSSSHIRSTAMSEALRTILLNMIEAKLRPTATPSKPIKVSAEVAKKAVSVLRTSEKRPREDRTLEKCPRPGKCLRPANITERDIVRFVDEKVRLATEECCRILQSKQSDGASEIYFLIRRTARRFAHLHSTGGVEMHRLGPGLIGAVFLCMKLMTHHRDLIRNTIYELKTCRPELRVDLLKKMVVRLLRQEILPGGEHVGDSMRVVNRLYSTRNSTIRVMYFVLVIFLDYEHFTTILHTLPNDLNHAIYTQVWYEEYQNEMIYNYESKKMTR